MLRYYGGHNTNILKGGGGIISHKALEGGGKRGEDSRKASACMGNTTVYHLEMDNLTRLQYIKHVKSSHSPVRVASQCPLIFTTLYTNHMVIRTCYHPKESERSRQKYKGNPFLSVKITRYFCLCHFASTTKTITGR